MDWLKIVPWGFVLPLVISGVIGYIAPLAIKYLNIATNSKAMADLKLLIQDAVNYGVLKAGGNPQDIIGNTKLIGDVIAFAQEYLEENAGFLLSKLGYSPTDGSLGKIIETEVIQGISRIVYVQGHITLGPAGLASAGAATVNITTAPIPPVVAAAAP